MSANFCDSRKTSILGLNGQIASFEGVGIGEHKSYKEYHKREVFLLRYFFLLSDSVLHIEPPEQFQVFESSLHSWNSLCFYPYRIEYSIDSKDFFIWIVLVTDKEGKLFVFARTKPCEVGVVSKAIDNSNLFWEKD